MLVGALRSDNPLGGAPLTCDDAAESFTLQGVGEISAAKLLDLENRRQLVWSDLVTREWVLETAAIRVRRQAVAKAAEAARAAAESARVEAESAAAGEPAAAGVAPGSETLVFGPPGLAEAPATPPSLPQSAAARRPAGVPAATTRFATPPDDGRVAGRVVWSEVPPASPAPPAPSGPPAPPAPSGLSKPSRPPAPWTPPPGAPDWPRQTDAPSQATVTRRADRRQSLKKAERRRRLGAVSRRAVIVALLTVVAVVVVLVAQHGGF
jgi:hypothetical protein